MRNFADLLCKDDPADNASSIVDSMRDLLSVAHRSLMDADSGNAERLANEVATLLEVLLACARRLDAGVDTLQREAKRGFWRNKPATGAEE